MNENDKKINYPCQWEYTVIGIDESAICEAIKDIFPQDTPVITPSNRSKTGKYVSFSFSRLVNSEEDRNNVFTTLQTNGAIKMIL